MLEVCEGCFQPFPDVFIGYCVNCCLAAQKALEPCCPLFTPLHRLFPPPPALAAAAAPNPKCRTCCGLAAPPAGHRASARPAFRGRNTRQGYNRALSCLVPIELKIGKFKPEHIGQINFYLEALDRDVKKPNENPSVGVILCASKDDAVVEYALSRSMSPTLVADYRLCLPDKTLLQNKLRELTELALESGEGNEGDEE